MSQIRLSKPGGLARPKGAAMPSTVMQAPSAVDDKAAGTARVWLSPARLIVTACLLAQPMFAGVATAQAGPAEQRSAGSAQALDAGLRAYRDGRFLEAAERWHDAVRDASDESTRRRSLARRGLAMSALGRQRDALADLQESLGPQRAGCEGEADPALLDALAGAYFRVGRAEAARRCNQRALESPLARDDIRLRAVLLNNRGLFLDAVDQTEDALAAFEQAARLAGQGRATIVEAKGLANQLALEARSSAASTPAGAAAANRVEVLWPRALQAARMLPDGADKSAVLLALGASLAEQAAARAGMRALGGEARSACAEADRIARRLKDRRSRVQADLCLSDLDAAGGNPAAALARARIALSASADPQYADLGFAALSRIAPLLRTLGRDDEALAAYRQAVGAHQDIREDLALARLTRTGGFGARVLPVYSGLADTLLRRASLDAGASASLLRETRNVLEGFKAAEFRDYFQDDCVDALRARRGAVEMADAGTAVLYPVLLADRIVLLISFPDGRILQRPAKLDRAALASAARNLREAIHQPATGEQYLVPARQLYDALLGGLEPEFEAAGVQTLAIVPDGPLRWIPFSVLHDGQGFLIERLAIATIPSLELVDARALRPARTDTLLAGLSIAVGDFPALRSVPSEIAGVQRTFGGLVLRDQAFTASALTRELSGRPFTVVHLASHGEFAGDASRSFLVTADGELSMDRLQGLMRLGQYRDKPVELLTLSACETAAGDDRAALGLAGLAMQAGARSALATLWRVHDASTALLITDFYSGLSAAAPLSKAQALRRAQMRLIENPQWRHPYYWSPFLLIGNWL